MNDDGTQQVNGYRAWVDGNDVARLVCECGKAAWYVLVDGAIPVAECRRCGMTYQLREVRDD